jgi:glutathione S-transferase
MRLYYTKMAPYPRRVSIYLAEKGIELERVEIDLYAMGHKSPEFLKMNPAGKVPVLQLDNGDFLPESAAIVEYLEESYPNPPMFGKTAEQRAQTRATERIADEIFTLLGQSLMHTAPAALKFHPGLTQHPEVGEALQPLLDQLLDQLEARIGHKNFLAGDSPTVADCTFFALMSAVYPGFGYVLPERCPRLRAWYERFQERPSAKAP